MGHCTLLHPKKEFLIRQTVQNVYLNAKGFGKKSPLSAEQELELRTEEFMQRRYEFRYNTMTTVTEYRERNTFCFCFRPVTNRTRNSIAMNARLEGLNLWDRDVARYLDSDRIPVFNPIEDFLFGVDIRWDVATASASLLPVFLATISTGLICFIAGS